MTGVDPPAAAGNAPSTPRPRTLIRTLVLALGGSMTVFTLLAVLLAVQGARETTLQELQRGFDRSAALAALVLDQEIQGAERAVGELARLPALEQAVRGDRPQQAARVLNQVQAGAVARRFDAVVLTRDAVTPWAAGGVALGHRGDLQDWLARRAATPYLSNTRLVIHPGDANRAPSLVLVVRRGVRDPATGRAVAHLAGAVILSDKLSLFNAIRRHARLEGVGLTLGDRLFTIPDPQGRGLAQLEWPLPVLHQGDSYLENRHVAWRPLGLAHLQTSAGVLMSVRDHGGEAGVLVRTVFLIGALMLVIMLGLLAFLTRYIGLPLRTLAAQARQSHVGPFQPLRLPQRHRADELLGLVTAFNDLIHRIGTHQAELDRIAHYDALTGVPNRRLLVARLERAVTAARRHGNPLAVCYLDLDGFKTINDRHGHAMGDRLLLEITGRLKDLLRAGDTLGRLGGDEFVILCNRIGSPDRADAALRRVLEAASAPVWLDGLRLQVSASIGVTFCPPDEGDPDHLLRHADQAMYQAKEAGRNRYHRFDPERHREVRDLQRHAERVRSALRDGELSVHYQPKVDLRTGDLLGAEALVRWDEPGCGLRGPDHFLPAFRAAGLEGDLDEWVLEQVFRQMESWRRAGFHCPVGVNVSGEFLLGPRFEPAWRRGLEAHPAVSPEDLQFEILETTTLADLPQASEVISRCLHHGAQFALDDFGTGYASLSYLRTLPVATLKIDRSFVLDMLQDPNDLDMVESIVRLARTFNKQVVAEGVETLDHAALLLRLGCVQAQGYAFTAALPPEALPPWVEQWRRGRTWEGLAHRLPQEGDPTLGLAARCHARWSGELMRVLAEGGRASPEADAALKRFERWYFGSGTNRYGEHPGFEELGRAHRRMRTQAQMLRKLRRRGWVDALQRHLPELQAARTQANTAFKRLMSACARGG
ncbi:putative bifunctional diguanylate cyclase/phosphodiesterase [Ectothiorhodospira mobilis]|uniref:putative bifunctional diguanylate cyclase/phosphodiesterase n=1 Tax=Ectothiorhodospira mobilis TaxID=195064 RepID=UPI001EE87129|nr:EAL domain-containing protein [Ectothiorhodospira mobilis]MCG5536064.1 EAL domain-containing protein [Ectothiorhodospira mobilis]